MSISYKVFTEYQPSIETLVARYFDSFSVYWVKGVYKQEPEASAVIEIIGNTEDDYDKVRYLAEAIKHDYEQKEVLITSSLVTAETI